MSAALQTYLDLLQRFADGRMDVEEFSARYWSIRFRSHLDKIELDSGAGHEMQPFERDLLTYMPDLEPDVRLVEDRELRRRAASTRLALMGRAEEHRDGFQDPEMIAG